MARAYHHAPAEEAAGASFAHLRLVRDVRLERDVRFVPARLRGAAKRLLGRFERQPPCRAAARVSAGIVIRGHPHRFRVGTKLAVRPGLT